MNDQSNEWLENAFIEEVSKYKWALTEHGGKRIASFNLTIADDASKALDIARNLGDTDALELALVEYGYLTDLSVTDGGTNYELIAASIWRSGYVPDKNKVRQEAKEDMRQLIAIDLAANFKVIDPNFDEAKFMKDCGLSNR